MTPRRSRPAESGKILAAGRRIGPDELLVSRKSLIYREADLTFDKRTLFSRESRSSGITLIGGRSQSFNDCLMKRWRRAGEF
jgi:hypothetical protein